MSQYCKHGWKGDCPMCAFEAPQTTPTVMSDTKQQCPTCHGAGNVVTAEWSNVGLFQAGVMTPSAPKVCGTCNGLGMVPVEGSGEPTSSGSSEETAMREQLEVQLQQDIDYWRKYGKSDSWLIVTVADHCTAPLRQQVDDLRRQRDLEWDSRKRAQSELTAERTRREVAERELKELREASAKITHAVGPSVDKCTGNDGKWKYYKISCDDVESLRAALRGKGE